MVETKLIALHAEWVEEPHQLEVTPAVWERICNGEVVRLEGAGYVYDGDTFRDIWDFNSPEPGELTVSYIDPQGDSGDGYIGDIKSALVSD